jgi:thermitase
MKKLLISALATLGVASAFGIQGSYVADEIYVKFANYANGRPLSPTMKKFILSKVGAQETAFYPQIGWSRVKLNARGNVEAAVATLDKERYVRDAEPVFIREFNATPNDPLYVNQKWLLPINVAPAWDLFKGSDQVIVGILDSGTELDHPDLENKLVPGEDMVDLDGDPSDTNGHGTGSAGMAAADTDNGIGVAAPGWNTLLMPIRVGDFGITHSVEGILYAADAGCEIINMSYGGGFRQQAEQDAINYAYARNVIPIASAGNSNLEDVRFYPAGLDNVVSVGASDDFDNRADFSNYGDWVDIAAPGVNTLTTAIGKKYGGFGGTSAAGPAAAGVTSLVRGYAPSGTTNTQVIEWVKQGCDDIGDWITHGRVNALRSLQLVPKFEDRDYPIIGMEMLFGTNTAGASSDLTDLDSSVAMFAAAKQQTMRSPATFTALNFDLSADANQIDELKVTLNAFVNANKVTQMIYVWDPSLNRWRFVRAFPVSTLSASVDNEAKISNARRYIDGNGHIRIGVRAFQPFGSVNESFNFVIDRAMISAKLLIN